MNNQKKIERFLLSDIAAELDRRALGPDEDLLEQRIIDSLGIMKLVSFLEQSFEIEVSDDDIVPENFQTITAILRYIDQKQARSSRAIAGQTVAADPVQPVHAQAGTEFLPHTLR